MNDRQVVCKPHLIGGIKRHNIEGISFPERSALCARSITCLPRTLKKTLLLRVRKLWSGAFEQLLQTPHGYERLVLPEIRIIPLT